MVIVPVLRYEDARAAIRWLERAFGFVLTLSVPESGPHVVHARLRLGDDVVMVGSVRDDDGIASPRAAGVATQALCVTVADVDSHHARAVAAGAVPDGPPKDTDFGARLYAVRDLEGHPWVFSQDQVPGERPRSAPSVP